MSAYTYLTPVIQDDNWQKLTTAIVLGAVLVFVGKLVTKKLRSPEDIDKEVVPAKKFSFFGFTDVFVNTFINYHDSVVGVENRKYVSFSGSIFLFLLTANLLGIIPGMPAATTTVWVNVGMAMVVFIYFNYLGIKENGLLKYLAHFLGPAASHKEKGELAVKTILWFIALPLFCIEIFSVVLRVLTLNLRLYWNISADHSVLEIVTGMLGPWGPSFLYILATFVCFMQAFIFTTLSMVYILLAVQHEEDH